MSLLKFSAGALVLIPLLASVLFVFAQGIPESFLRRISRKSSLLILLAMILTIVGAFFFKLPIEVDYGMLYQSEGYHFPLVLYFDVTTFVFLIMTTIFASLVVSYSRVYLHRESGYNRFFSCIFLVWAGLNLLFSAGTLDLLFAGWEMVGISSFLLIAFYWQRRNPSLHAFRAYCVYRFCDVGLLLGTWLNHHLWHGAERFSQLALPSTHYVLANMNPFWVFILGTTVILAASGKSAQFPFLFWLPKAMEGPTPSSAIFYGALSVHAGVFLLIRTFAIWHSSQACVYLVAGIGLLTVLKATVSGRAQSNIKAQIAMASAAQVGLQFFELSLGLIDVALVHFVANAGFRCYQILVSPSIVAYLLRLQGSVSAQIRLIQNKKTKLPKSLFPKTLRSTLYVLALHDGYVEGMLMALIHAPLKSLHRMFSGRVVWEHGGWAGFVVGILLLLTSWYGGRHFSADVLSWGLCAASIAAAIVALVEPYRLRAVWYFSGASCSFASIAVILQSPDSLSDVLVYLSGLVGFWMLGMAAIARLEAQAPEESNLKPFCWGAGEKVPYAGLVLLIAFLGISGFPLSPTFIGIDLLLHHIGHKHEWMSAVLSLAFVTNGIAIVRSMVPLHFGPYVR